MPLDPEARALLDQMAAAGIPTTSSVPIDEARAGMARRRAVLNAAPESIAEVYDRTVPGPAGEIPVRVYRPTSDGMLPVLMYYHGGGWVIGDLDSHDNLCR